MEKCACRRRGNGMRARFIQKLYSILSLNMHIKLSAASASMYSHISMAMPLDTLTLSTAIHRQIPTLCCMLSILSKTSTLLCVMVLYNRLIPNGSHYTTKSKWYSFFHKIMCIENIYFTCFDGITAKLSQQREFATFVWSWLYIKKHVCSCFWAQIKAFQSFTDSFICELSSVWFGSKALLLQKHVTK